MKIKTKFNIGEKVSVINKFLRTEKVQCVGCKDDPEKRKTCVLCNGKGRYSKYVYRYGIVDCMVSEIKVIVTDYKPWIEYTIEHKNDKSFVSENYLHTRKEAEKIMREYKNESIEDCNNMNPKLNKYSYEIFDT